VSISEILGGREFAPNSAWLFYQNPRQHWSAWLQSGIPAYQRLMRKSLETWRH
jgi:hypothetical protein